MARADAQVYTLLSNGAASGAAVDIRGGIYMFMAEGTASGATLGLQIQSPNGTWSDIFVFSASKVSTTTLPFAQTGVDLPAGKVRVVITGGPPSAVFAYLAGIG